MKTFAIIATAAAFALSPVAAHAGGWGKSSGSFLNLSPSVDVGNVGVLNGSAILSGNNILSGNAVGILNGSLNNIANGTLNNIGIGILGGGGKKRH
jgi:hypothetical protein